LGKEGAAYHTQKRDGLPGKKTSKTGKQGKARTNPFSAREAQSARFAKAKHRLGVTTEGGKKTKGKYAHMTRGGEENCQRGGRQV